MILRKVTASASLATVLLVTQAAAAPESETQETAAPQAQADDHSYLPPWMRPQPAEAGTASAKGDAQFAAGDPAKQKAALPGQKPVQRHRGVGLFGLMNSLNPFGR